MDQTEGKVSIHTLLSSKYPENEYALMYEVRDNAGFEGMRSADAIAVNLWPSRGYSITGFEIKASRSDWLSELKRPEKAEAIMKYCNFWNLVVENESIAKEDEIPKTWGLLVRKGNKLYTKKKAPELTPETPSLGFIACMLKRATQGKGMIPKDSIKQEIEYAVSSALSSNERPLQQKLNNMEHEFNKLIDLLDEFKKETGLDIRYDYSLRNIPKFAQAVHFIMRGGIERFKEELRQISETHKEQHDKLESFLNNTTS